MIGRLFARGEEFFSLFERSAAYVVKGANELLTLVEQHTPREKLAESVARIKGLEHDCDDITHQVIERVNKTFITPIDREDIYTLITRLDSILDLIDDTAMRIKIYSLDLTGPHAERLIQIARLLFATTQELAGTVSRLRSLKKPQAILASCVEVNRLENEADQLFQDSLAELIRTEKDPLLILEWKELYEMLESAVDTCEDMANILESIVIKHS